ncbi:MAG: hypothetical protein NT145_04720, partial [Elusimicrobia bacterium]|nr:hypothetical protein [Elusimicrobiota bacterium]
MRGLDKAVFACSPSPKSSPIKGEEERQNTSDTPQLAAGRFIFFKFKNLMKLFNFKKAVAVVTVTAFLFTSVFSQALHAIAVTNGETSQQVKLALDGLTIPYSLGRITDGRYFGSDKVVINIQDLHCHSEVQRNISKILGLLDEKYHLKKIYIEGSVGQLNTSWVNVLEDKKLREKVIETFIESGRLTGTEYYSIEAKKPDLLIGIEDASLYNANILRLEKILSQQSEIQSKIPEIKAKLGMLKEKYYSRENARLEKILNRYKKNEITTEKLYRLLIKLADKSKVNIYDYVAIKEYLRLVKEQKGLNYKKISKQLAELINQLKTKMPYETYRLLLEKTQNLSRLDELYINLSEISKLYNIELTSKFKEVNDFLNFVKSNQAINPIDLVREERTLIRELHYRTSQCVAEEEVSYISDFFSYIEEYLSNKIGAGDYAFISKNMAEFKEIWGKYAILDQVVDLSPYYNLFDGFYQTNVERNKFFIKNILGEIPAKNQGKVRSLGGIDHVRKLKETLKDAKEVMVVVTGGFHTEGLTRLLEDRDISYLVVTPNVTKDTKYSQKFYDQLAKAQAKEYASQTMALIALTSELQGKTAEEVKQIILTNKFPSDLLRVAISNSLKEKKNPKEIEQTVNGVLGKDNKFGMKFKFEREDATNLYFSFEFTDEKNKENRKIEIVYSQADNKITAQLETSKPASEEDNATAINTYKDFANNFFNKYIRRLPEDWWKLEKYAKLKTKVQIKYAPKHEEKYFWEVTWEAIQKFGEVTFAQIQEILKEKDVLKDFIDKLLKKLEHENFRGVRNTINDILARGISYFFQLIQPVDPFKFSIKAAQKKAKKAQIEKHQSLNVANIIKNPEKVATASGRQAKKTKKTEPAKKELNPAESALVNRLNDILKDKKTPLLSLDIGGTTMVPGSELSDSMAESLIGFLEKGGNIVFNSDADYKNLLFPIYDPLSTLLATNNKQHLATHIYFIFKTKILQGTQGTQEGGITTLQEVSPENGKGKNLKILIDLLNKENKEDPKKQFEILAHIGSDYNISDKEILEFPQEIPLAINVGKLSNRSDKQLVNAEGVFVNATKNLLKALTDNYLSPESKPDANATMPSTYMAYPKYMINEVEKKILKEKDKKTITDLNLELRLWRRIDQNKDKEKWWLNKIEYSKEIKDCQKNYAPKDEEPAFWKATLAVINGEMTLEEAIQFLIKKHEIPKNDEIILNKIQEGIKKVIQAGVDAWDIAVLNSKPSGRIKRNELNRAGQEAWDIAKLFFSPPDARVIFAIQAQITEHMRWNISNPNYVLTADVSEEPEPGKRDPENLDIFVKTAKSRKNRTAIINLFDMVGYYNEKYKTKYTLSQAADNADIQAKVIENTNEELDLPMVYPTMDLSILWEAILKNNGFDFERYYEEGQKRPSYRKRDPSIPDKERIYNDNDVNKLLEKLRSLEGLVNFDPMKDGLRMIVQRDMVKKIKKKDPSIKVMGIVPAPLTVFSYLLGDQLMLTLALAKHEGGGPRVKQAKELSDKLFEYVRNLTIKYVDALIDAGVDSICLCDPVIGMPKFGHTYVDKFVVGQLNPIIEHINKRNVAVLVHMCGMEEKVKTRKTEAELDKMLEGINKIKAQAFSFQIPIKRARKIIKKRPIFGGADTKALGTSKDFGKSIEEIRQNAKKLAKYMKKDKLAIACSTCETEAMTPLPNLVTMFRTVSPVPDEKEKCRKLAEEEYSESKNLQKLVEKEECEKKTIINILTMKYYVSGKKVRAIDKKISEVSKYSLISEVDEKNGELKIWLENEANEKSSNPVIWMRSKKGEEYNFSIQFNYVFFNGVKEDLKDKSLGTQILSLCAEIIPDAAEINLVVENEETIKKLKEYLEKNQKITLEELIKYFAEETMMGKVLSHAGFGEFAFTWGSDISEIRRLLSLSINVPISFKKTLKNLMRRLSTFKKAIDNFTGSDNQSILCTVENLALDNKLDPESQSIQDQFIRYYNQLEDRALKDKLNKLSTKDKGLLMIYASIVLAPKLEKWSFFNFRGFYKAHLFGNAKKSE